MKILIVEDDQLQSQALERLLQQELTDTTIQRIYTESDFRLRFDELASNCPDVVLMDVMLRWADPSPNMPQVPEDVVAGGFYMAGLRCVRMLVRDHRTRKCHIIVHSVLAQDAFANELAGIGQKVIVLSKTASHDQLVQMLRFLSRASTNVQLAPRKVFIVHGRDSTTREMVARYLQRIGLIPVILGEIAAHGSRTSIEKLEANSDVAFAVALLTADEVGGQDDGPPQSRASQNAILELGYFVGRLGRRNVCVLCKDLLDLPSDYQGVIRIRLDATGSWQMQLATELRAAGLPCDLNSLL